MKDTSKPERLIFAVYPPIHPSTHPSQPKPLNGHHLDSGDLAPLTIFILRDALLGRRRRRHAHPIGRPTPPPRAVDFGRGSADGAPHQARYRRIVPRARPRRDPKPRAKSARAQARINPTPRDRGYSSSGRAREAGLSRDQ
jgi:hypothetical protein